MLQPPLGETGGLAALCDAGRQAPCAPPATPPAPTETGMASVCRRATGSNGDGRGLNIPPRHWLQWRRAQRQPRRWLRGRRARPQSAAAPLAPRETGAASIRRRATGSNGDGRGKSQLAAPQLPSRQPDGVAKRRQRALHVRQPPRRLSAARRANGSQGDWRGVVQLASPAAEPPSRLPNPRPVDQCASAAASDAGAPPRNRLSTAGAVASPACRRLLRPPPVRWRRTRGISCSCSSGNQSAGMPSTLSRRLSRDRASACARRISILSLPQAARLPPAPPVPTQPWQR